MAKVVITIEDLPNGKVRTVCEPNFETMMKMKMSGGELTSAHGYAFQCLNAIREESKRRGPTKILIPRLIKN